MLHQLRVKHVMVMKANNKFKLFKIQAFILPGRVKVYRYKIFKILLRNFQSKAALSADMFESVNKKTLVHPLFKVGFSLLKKTP